MKSSPGLWSEFIPLAFHVDYWDYIGWPDRFAAEEYTERQYQHAAEQSMRTVYTPGFFLDGKEYRWRRRELARELPRSEPGVLRLDVADRDATVHFEPASEHDRLTVTVALLGFGIQTDVGAGENRGRTLTHDFVVLDLAAVPMNRSGEAFTAMLKAPDRDVEAERYALVAWVTPRGSQQPIQSTGGWWDAG